MFYRLKQVILLSVDLIILYFGLIIGVFARNLRILQSDLEGFESPRFWLITAAVIIMYVLGLYDVGRAKNNLSFYKKISISALAWFTFSVFFFYISPTATISPKTTLFLITVFGFGGISIWRSIYNKYISANLLQTSVAFVGYNAETKEIIDAILKFPEKGYVLFGVISEDQILQEIKSGKTLNELIQINGGAHPSLIVVSDNLSGKTLVKELFEELYNQVSIRELAEFYEYFFRRVPPFTYSEDWFITNLNEQNLRIYDRFKILLDYFFAIITGIFFIITFPLIALLIKINSSGPILFAQKRIGRLGKEFYIYKYRTMKALDSQGSAEMSGPQYASINDSRITAVGKFLRKTRLDEIPQFWNILKGEMSIIGPRPERPEFVKLLTEQMPFYRIRHLIKPGITGWAQLQASYFGTIEENLKKLEYDLYYVKNRNFFLDSMIIIKTFGVLIKFMGR